VIMAQFLYQTIEALEQAGFLQDIPEFIEQGLSEHIVLRDYQRRAFQYFVTYYENEKLKKKQADPHSFPYGNGFREDGYYGWPDIISLYKGLSKISFLCKSD